jgi:DNA-directed RNA polymerase alpha subunit
LRDKLAHEIASDEAGTRGDIMIEDAGASIRTRNCLESVGVRTLNQLAIQREADLLKIRAFGKTSLRECKAILERHGMRLGYPSSPTPSSDADPSLLRCRSTPATACSTCS